ncbi:expressed protein, partial [Phakopsora pachyrhizi]
LIYNCPFCSLIFIFSSSASLFFCIKMSNHSFSPVNDSKFDNLNSEQTHEQDDNSNGTFKNLDPELEQFECMQKIN